MTRTTFVPYLIAMAWLPTACGDVQAPDDPLVQRCAMYLKMDEAAWNGTAGEVQDACGNDDRGQAKPGVTTVPNGARGRAGSFTDRLTHCIEVPDSPRLRPVDKLTLSAWVMPKGLGLSEEAFGIISKRTRKDVDDSYNLSLWTENKAWVELQNSPDRFPGTTVLVNDRWTQLTMVYDGALGRGERVRLFVDGVLDRVGAEDATMLSAAAIPLRVGCMPGLDETTNMAANQGFVGLLDDVVIWTRALDDEEVADWYTRTNL